MASSIAASWLFQPSGALPTDAEAGRRSAPRPGAFSGLFGVGGGTVIVPLLILWFGYGERLATGTSLAAIVLIALLAAAAQGGSTATSTSPTGLLLRVPAVGGVVLGTAVQQRISQRAVSLLSPPCSSRSRSS